MDFNVWSKLLSQCFLVDLSTIAQTGLPVLSQPLFATMVQREKARADCNGHGFSLLTVPLRQEMDLEQLTTVLRRQIRRTDEIGWLDENLLSVFLYNTGPLEVAAFVNKVGRELAPGNSSALRRGEVYSYPAHWKRDKGDNNGQE